MNKLARPKASATAAKAARTSGLLRNVARVGATLVATRVAAATGKKGAVGLLAGMGAKRIIMRYPVGALFVTGAYLVGKLYEAKLDADAKRNQKLLPDKSGDPVQLADARKARNG